MGAVGAGRHPVPARHLSRHTHGAVAELADAGDLKSSGVGPRVGSSPTRPTWFGVVGL